jgi:hypothetical protein
MNSCRDYLSKPKGMDAVGILKWAAEEFGQRVTLASSFGAEDQALE